MSYNQRPGWDSTKPVVLSLGREQALADVEAYLARGNEIEEVPVGVSGMTPDGRMRSMVLGRSGALSGPVRERLQAKARLNQLKDETDD